MKVEVRPSSPTIRRERPNLKFCIAFYEADKKRHRFFETAAAANEWANFKNAELEKYGIEGAGFPERLRVEARDAVERLMPFGKTITDAVNHYVAHLKASERSCTAAELVDKLLAWKKEKLLAAKKADGAIEQYLRGIQGRLKVFAKQFDSRIVATITTNEIDEWLQSLPVGPQTRKHYRQLTVLAFNFAVRKNYATSNPASDVEGIKVDRPPPGILTVDEAARLLEAATSDVLPFIAIGLFAGLRRTEIERLDWSEIDFESNLIEIKAAKSKTAQRRFVKIEPNLAAWLMPLRQHKGSVMPEDYFRQSFEQLRKTAGIKQWPHNALRHSFASYHLAHFKNAAATALEMGHTNAAITFKHYRELVKPKDAALYWNHLLPSASASEKVVQMVT
jgi:integrase